MTGSFGLWKPTSPNIDVAGCGRLRRPPSQTASWLAGLGSQIPGVSEPEPGNSVVEAVSATAGSLSESQKVPDGKEDPFSTPVWSVGCGRLPFLSA